MCLSFARLRALVSRNMFLNRCILFFDATNGVTEKDGQVPRQPRSAIIAPDRYMRILVHIFASLTHAYHYLMKLITKKSPNI